MALADRRLVALVREWCFIRRTDVVSTVDDHCAIEARILQTASSSASAIAFGTVGREPWAARDGHSGSRVLPAFIEHERNMIAAVAQQ